MEALGSSETLMTICDCMTHNHDDSTSHIHHCENQKPYKSHHICVLYSMGKRLSLWLNSGEAGS